MIKKKDLSLSICRVYSPSFSFFLLIHANKSSPCLSEDLGGTTQLSHFSGSNSSLQDTHGLPCNPFQNGIWPRLVSTTLPSLPPALPCRMCHSALQLPTWGVPAAALPYSQRHHIARNGMTGGRPKTLNAGSFTYLAVVAAAAAALGSLR